MGLVIVIVFVIMGFSLLIIYSEFFRKLMLELFEGTKVTQKINDLMLSVQSGEADGSVGDRTTRYMASINTIINYPIIGGLWMCSIGNHSAILDSFAKYGLFGGCIFSKMLFSVNILYKEKTKDKFMVQVLNASLAALLIVGMLNATPYQCMLPFTVVLLSIIGEIRILKYKSLKNITNKKNIRIMQKEINQPTSYSNIAEINTMV